MILFYMKVIGKAIRLILKSLFFSVTKSFVSTLVGIAIDEKRIKGTKEHRNKGTNEPGNKQTNKHMNKQTNKQTHRHTNR